jgi:hypothetical protein
MRLLKEKHDVLEGHVADELQSLGYLVTRATYHEVMNEEVANRLKGIYDPTALYVRGRADRIAVHRYHPTVFEFEAKTHESERYNDLTIEALPMVHHIARCRLGVRCLYVYHNPAELFPRGFWVGSMPRVRDLWIPGRWQPLMAEFFRKTFSEFFPGIEIKMGARVSGSGDPFLVVAESDVLALPDWRLLVPHNEDHRNGSPTR